MEACHGSGSFFASVEGNVHVIVNTDDVNELIRVDPPVGTNVMEFLDEIEGKQERFRRFEVCVCALYACVSYVCVCVCVCV